MTAPERSLSRSVVTRYAIGSLGTGGFATLPGLVLVFYLTDTLGVAALVAGLVVTAAKVWDVLDRPVDRRAQRPQRSPRPARVARGCVVGALALPVSFVADLRGAGTGLAPAASGTWVFVAFLRHGHRVQPLPGAVHRAARRAHRRLRRAHAAPHLARRGADLRDPAVRRGRTAAAARRRRRRDARLPGHGGRRRPRDRRRDARGHVHRAARASPRRDRARRSIRAGYARRHRRAASQPARSAPCSPPSCCRASPPASCSRARNYVAVWVLALGGRR